jgi:hypothetical protein
MQGAEPPIPCVFMMYSRIHKFGLITKTNTQIVKELKITPILDKLLEYKRN